MFFLFNRNGCYLPRIGMYKTNISPSVFQFIDIFCQSIFPQICYVNFFYFFSFQAQCQHGLCGLMLTSESVEVFFHQVCGHTVQPEYFGIEPTAVLPGLDALPASLPRPSPALPNPTHQWHLRFSYGRGHPASSPSGGVQPRSFIFGPSTPLSPGGRAISPRRLSRKALDDIQ